MPERSFLQKLLLGVCLAVGIFPIAYFVSVETGIAQAATQDLTSIANETSENETSFDRYIENVSFGVGEKLSFDINYGFVNAGTATMSVLRMVEYENRPCYQVVTQANSNKFFSSLYKVDDRIESIMDAVGIFSWHFDKRLREGNYRSDRKYAFDQRTNLVYYKDDTISVPPFVQDAISTLYYIRTQPLEVGKTFVVDNFVDGRMIRLDVKVTKKEKITVSAGTFDCFKVEPMSKTVGIFKSAGRMTIWLTDDRVKMPVLMKSKIAVGSISAELTDFELGELSDF